MRDRTGIAGLLVADKITRLIKSNMKWLQMAASGITGFLMARSFIFGGVAPFGVALSAAFSGINGYSAAVGALLGYVLTPHMLGNAKYIAAVLIVCILRWTLGARLVIKKSAAHSVGMAFAAMLISSAAVLFAMDCTLYDVLLGIAETLLACGTAYFFSRTLTALAHGLGGASRSDVSCVIVSFAVILMGFSGIRLGGLSLGRILSAILIMLCARYGGEAAGAVAGVTAGIAIGLSGKDYTYVMSAYSLGGLVSGVFSSMGRLAAAGSFIVVNALTALFVAENVDLYTAVFEIFAASAIFMLIPQSLAKNLRISAAGILGSPDTGSAQMALRDKLTDISGALKEIGSSTKKVSEKLGKLEGLNVSRVYNSVADKVCRRCGMKTKCWQQNYGETVEALKSAIRTLKKSGSINRDTAPAYFIKTCCKMDMLLAEINTSFSGHVAKEGVQRKVSKVRSVVTDQFEGIAMMLDSLSEELCSIRLLEPGKSIRVKDYFEKEGFLPEQALCYYGEYERLCAEIQVPAYQAARLNKSKAAADIGEILDAEFDIPQITSRGNSVTVAFSEKATLTIELGAYQIACGHSRLCGDSYEIIRERAGKSHIILSDGMGSGGGAAVDSAMASGLLTSLLSVGIGHEAALKMVNSALLVKSGEESLATIDICTLDLYTGKVDFYKAGAAPSFVLRGTRAGLIESSSLPAGILRGVAFEKSSLSLKAGDVIVMVSDGVVATGLNWVASEIESIGGGDMQRLCEKLAMAARTRREDGHEDDITVVAAALQKGI